MSRKVLKALFPERCIGCELCVMAAQRQFKKAGLDGSFIRILRQESGYSVDIDPQAGDLDVEKIKKICPTLVFSVEDGVDESAK